jgi:hypothetical protein
MGKEWDALRDGARESLGRAEQLRYLDHSVFRWWLALDMAPGHFINLGSSLTRLALSDLSFFFSFYFTPIVIYHQQVWHGFRSQFSFDSTLSIVNPTNSGFSFVILRF